MPVIFQKNLQQFGIAPTIKLMIRRFIPNKEEVKKIQKIDSSFSEIWARLFNLRHMKENEHKTLNFTLKSF